MWDLSEGQALGMRCCSMMYAESSILAQRDQLCVYAGIKQIKKIVLIIVDSLS